MDKLKESQALLTAGVCMYAPGKAFCGVCGGWYILVTWMARHSRKLRGEGAEASSRSLFQLTKDERFNAFQR